MIADRQKEIDDMYAEADNAKNEAKALETEYKEKLSVATETSDRIVKEAVTRAQMQMIGVGKFHLTADVFQIFSTECTFNCTLCANIHKYRGLDSTVGAGKFATAGLSFRFQKLKHNILTYPINIASPKEKKR